MPKKMGVNTKAEAARERRSAAEADRRDRDARAKEEAYWQAAEGPKSRSARRREEDAEKRAEAAARRAENRRLAELEQQQLAAAARRPDRKAARVGPVVPKVTEAELLRRRVEERIRLEREAEAANKRQARTAEEEEYERVVLVANTNRDDSIIEARSVEDAIVKMSIAAEPALPPDRRRERRLKVSYKAFEEAELAKLKEEKPGLTLHQYKDMIWKLWKKSPDNPLNQAAD
uniref:Coiled-coil domain-containing protein n=1 Tax=Oryza meridionalis TaxID=40149 RepID=A0A0E0CUQ3_9ORYZ